MAESKGQLYQDGKSIGANQLNPHVYERKALIEARKDQYFGQLASVKAMPKNSGKEIKLYHYIPLLDDENINDQGIDATGATITNGNLYGSSKDIGSIPSKMPALGETGGRVNRVGFSRKELSGTFEKFGFFTEYSADLLNFDSDAELLTHINRELLNGAMELTEDALQIDLINNAGTIRYAGAAMSNAELGDPNKGGTADASVLTYKDLMAVSIDLDNNRTPKHTTIIKGTRLVDTVTLPSARVAYCGSEMIPTLESIKDLHGNPAWVPAHKYAAGTTLLNGERGQIGEFRFVIVPEMMKWNGGGAPATDSKFHATDGKYDVLPILVVGDESFTTIGFQTDGKTVKFDITHKKPGKETADKTDPYGEMGFISIKWWYGFMVLRGERIALFKSLAVI
ncbi:N4-gp56 family major capsid protein [Acinetobacter baumannii]|uniref:N4-gp56 family major capsid protein n=1 Tax=Acinetobacter baumannii TaxID=470 RepID=UPI001FF64781|nr:N4-gp56 family major capsid protein [Acinetobacter baumannii]MCJ9119030.1 N4-gp56 family major capsid protein [Acinetobacter baumannii]MDO5926319.1 N4-gp56 family major capsid protein [Acinetobacter baumannii]HDU7846655.1 N4-gp56 family major capsid protein [Acinetobacter baumannii]